jgi:long-chain acyl-CoA synthetase
MRYSDRPWLARYGRPLHREPGPGTMLDAFRDAVERRPDDVALHYFDGALTLAVLDRRSDALAVALAEHGFRPGDRLALYLQNDPAFVVGLLAAWKAGGIAVAVNPMNRARELELLLADSGAAALLCLDELYRDVAVEVVGSGRTLVRTVILASGFDDQTRDDPRVLAPVAGPADPTQPLGQVGGTAVAGEPLRLAELQVQYDGEQPDPPDLRPQDVAVLTYTSGTTGRPKGAMNTHRAMVFNSATYRDWMGLTEQDAVLGLAPLFHITGLVGHVGVALLLPCPLVLSHRFHPEVMLEAIREHRPTFTIGAVTAFTALLAASPDPRADLAPLRVVYSGGAPIAPALAEGFAERTGLTLHNIYGLTETTSPSHAVPLGARAPIDPTSGALSVGVPVFETTARILDDDGAEVPVGQVGEIAISGPQVVPGYWNLPQETAAGMPGGELRTGDVGFMDPDGWFYVVDRKKDMINAAGYKVWPREVEDVLYRHPAVLEAAVVGVPDEYRGETVKAYVTLRPGMTASPEELVGYAREQLAAYKYPRVVELVEALPKTSTGKILRRELRDRR